MANSQKKLVPNVALTIPPVAALALSVAAAAAAIGISERTARALIASGRLGHCRIGRRVLVPVSAIHALLGEEAATK